MDSAPTEPLTIEISDSEGRCVVALTGGVDLSSAPRFEEAIGSSIWIGLSHSS